MKALIRNKYGPPREVIQVVDLPRPSPKDDEVLIKVLANTVNRTDSGVLRGEPFLFRFFTGLPNPKKPILGTDFSGEVVEVGKNVTAYKKGDKIFGLNDEGMATYAQYICQKPSKNIAKIPEGFSHAQATACLEGGFYAWNILQGAALKPGSKVLINGATGAIGTALLQMCKYHDMDVLVVCGTNNIELMKQLGADQILDYQENNYWELKEEFDAILDTVGNKDFKDVKHLMTKKGVYISTELGHGTPNYILALTTRFTGGKRVKFPIPGKIDKSMAYIKQLVAENKFKPIIDRHYPADKIAEAFDYVEKGHKTGNVILEMHA